MLKPSGFDSGGISRYQESMAHGLRLGIHSDKIRADQPGVRETVRRAVLKAVFLSVLVGACSPANSGLSGNEASCVPTGLRPSFVVASYNIHAGVGKDGVRDLARVARTLGGAELVGLQEVDHRRLRSRLTNQTQVIAELLKHSYWEHFPAEDYALGGSYGNAVTSSLPVVGSGSFELPIIEDKPRRRLAWIKFLVDCRPVLAFVTHLTTVAGPDDLQWPQMAAALAFIDTKVGTPPIRHIMMGDFNSGPRGAIIPKLRARFVDTVELNTPDVLARPQVDYVFIGGDLEVVEARLLDGIASDHPAVLATLR
jgi:endonuclease/exonuclease/phosphatase family metal-dependent hydrolase